MRSIDTSKGRLEVQTNRPDGTFRSLFNLRKGNREAITALLLLLASTGSHIASHAYRTAAKDSKPLQNVLNVLDGMDYIQGVGSLYPQNYWNGDPYGWDNPKSES